MCPAEEGFPAFLPFMQAQLSRAIATGVWIPRAHFLALWSCSVQVPRPGIACMQVYPMVARRLCGYHDMNTSALLCSNPVATLRG